MSDHGEQKARETGALAPMRSIPLGQVAGYEMDLGEGIVQRQRERHLAEHAARSATWDAPERCPSCGAPAWSDGEHGITWHYLPREALRDDFAIFADAVRAEVEQAERRWPDNEFYHRIAALVGEVGELAQGKIKGEPLADLEHEAIQVAGCAYRAFRALREPTEPTP